MSGTQTLKYPLAAYGGATGLEIQLNAASTCSSSMYPGHSSPPLYGDLNEEGYSDGKYSRPDVLHDVYHSNIVLSSLFY